MSNRESDRAEHGAHVPHIVICQCTDAKRDGPAPAGELYDESDYFRKQRAYAEAVGDRWFIQSAKHGLLEPGEVIERYDMHANDVDMPEEWATRIALDLSDAVERPATVELLGGSAYTDPLTPELEILGFDVHEPLRGQQIGERKQTLARMVNEKLGAFV